MSGAARVLVVEDDPLIAALICNALEDAAFEVDGPYDLLADGMAAVATQFPDYAVLDVHLGQQDVAMLAGDLQAYGIGFAFCSGAAPQEALMRRFPDAPFIAKPVNWIRLTDLVTSGTAHH